MLSGKTILLGVSGSIAAYKIANLASMLVKAHADVHVIMTRLPVYNARDVRDANRQQVHR